MSTQPTRLKFLVQQRHWQTHRIFCAEYDKAAQAIDETLVGSGPSRPQLHRWLSGSLTRLPHPYNCRVLEAMFPGWSAQQLFEQHVPNEAQPMESETTRDSSEATGSGLQTPVDIHRSAPLSRPTLARSQSVDTDLAAFLGEDAIENGVALVYPTFELNESVVNALSTAGIPRQNYYQKRGSAFTANHRIDVPTALAENDVRAVLYVFALLQGHTFIQSSIVNDREVVAQCDRAFISFGLSSNDCTHMYLRHAQDPLFRITDDPDADSYLEYLELRDGTKFLSNEESNIGIIARVRPDAVLNPSRYWFYCAGLGPLGTSGAAWFMANNWRTLHSKVGDNDFLAAISVQTYSDQSARLEHLYVDQ